MPPLGFEPTIAVGERPYTYALDRAATGTGNSSHNLDVYVADYEDNTRLILINGINMTVRWIIYIVCYSEERE
jgi:hypothetical protein